MVRIWCPASLIGVLLCGLAAASAAAPKEKTPPPKDDYYELYKLLADTIDQVERNYVKEVDRRELFEAAIRGMMGRLDPYSAYIGPEELGQFKTTVDNEFGGIGIHIALDTGDLRVLSPIYGSPAYRAGILPGDRIVAIDGKSTENILLDEAYQRMKGKEGTPVTLTIVHTGRTKREKITLTREKVHVETVLGDHRRPDDTWDFMFDAKARIGYIRVAAFSRDTAAELRKALEQLQAQKVRGLVLDLRFNPGGLLSSAIEVSNLFISKGRIVSTTGRNTPERTWDARSFGAFEGFPVAILVNHYTASASEIVSACLQDHKRAVVVGERTWGKGSVQNIIELEDGRSALKLTTAAYRRPSGKNIHRFPDSKDRDEWGVMPDPKLEVPLTERETLALLAQRREKDILNPHRAADRPEETGAKSKPAAKAEGPAAEPKALAAKPAGEAKAGGPGKAAAGPKPAGEAAPAAKVPFVDRQFDAAVKYLQEELGRKK